MHDYEPKEKWSLFTKIFIVAAAIFLFLFILNAFRERDTPISQKSVDETSYHLNEAKRAISENRLSDAVTHLSKMNMHSQEWETEGKALWDKLGPFMMKDRKEKKRIKDQANYAKRIEFAKTYEKGLLDNWLDVRVGTSGQHHDTLEITFILINRPFVHNFQKNNQAMTTLNELGFKRVILSDGYGFKTIVILHE